jgi:Domain of unknown function (DUF222)
MLGGGWRTRDSAESWPWGSLAQRRVDALQPLAEAALGERLGQTERGESYQVMFTSMRTFLRADPMTAVLNWRVAREFQRNRARRLACDAPHVTVAEDTEGNVLHIGRKARKISKPLWRVLMNRDRTCQFPGCSRTRHLRAHHIEHWARGGETNPANLVPLSRLDHWGGATKGESGWKAGLLRVSVSAGRMAASCPPVPFAFRPVLADLTGRVGCQHNRRKGGSGSRAGTLRHASCLNREPRGSRPRGIDRECRDDGECGSQSSPRASRSARSLFLPVARLFAMNCSLPM